MKVQTNRDVLSHTVTLPVAALQPECTGTAAVAVARKGIAPLSRQLLQSL